ncbi:MAG TPA: transposase, partial [Anaerolineales bacterium]
MSLPQFSTQSELFSTAALSARLFAPTDRYRLFAQKVYARLADARDVLAQCYCLDNGRTAIEPVLLLGVSILQEIQGVPDRQAVELLRYHAGWQFALNRQLGDPVFHPTSLVNFRNRINEHGQGAVAFKTILDGLVELGWVSPQSRQRLDSTQMFGRVAKMNRLDCMRETMRLTLLELQECIPVQERPVFWVGFWERYVEGQVDYRASEQALGHKLGEAGADAWRLLEWLRQPEQSSRAAGVQAQLLRRVFGEQFEVIADQAKTREKEPVVTAGESEAAAPEDSSVQGPQTQGQAPLSEAEPCAGATASEPASNGQTQFAQQVMGSAAPIRPKGKGELDSDRVQNPHDPQATYAVKGRGQQKKEHVGYKVQVAETVSEVALAAGEPTGNFIVGIVAHAAYQSDELGAVKMEEEQARMGMDKPAVKYVDAAYISGQELAQAKAEGRELIGPAQPAPRKDGRFSAEDFQVNVEERTAICPAAKTSTQCSRLQE